MDENKKVVVNLPEGTTQAEIIVREGAVSYTHLTLPTTPYV